MLVNKDMKCCGLVEHAASWEELFMPGRIRCVVCNKEMSVFAVDALGVCAECVDYIKAIYSDSFYKQRLKEVC